MLAQICATDPLQRGSTCQTCHYIVVVKFVAGKHVAIRVLPGLPSGGACASGARNPTKGGGPVHPASIPGAHSGTQQGRLSHSPALVRRFG